MKNICKLSYKIKQSRYNSRQPTKMSRGNMLESHEVSYVQLPQFEPGSTPLHIACQRLHLECVEALVTAGADVTSMDKDGMTPIDVLGEKLVGGSYLHAAAA